MKKSTKPKKISIIKRKKRLHSIVKSNMNKLNQCNFRLLDILRCIESCQRQYDNCMASPPTSHCWGQWVMCTNGCKNHISKELKEFEKTLKKIIVSTNKDIRALSK